MGALMVVREVVVEYAHMVVLILVVEVAMEHVKGIAKAAVREVVQVLALDIHIND